ncbi:phytanoyl-CoA dioxygenase domain-containing protein 1 [Patella vulgata]|uniref:phytanoyl-CoA dioxygenase domain-containing protein 1 n=1 Tax=Patella vulgata TaxID=6465 RepID=UPI002180046B|nr:phytanoyl-CoA dioxygenase domain-containing protein 1 [Patella vulgata]
MALFDKEKFEKDGYIVIDDFLSEEDITALRSECWNMIEEMKPEEHCPSVFNTTDPKKHLSNDYFMTSGDKIRFFFEEGAIDDKGKLLVDKQRSINKMGHAFHALNPVYKRVTFSEKVKNIMKSLNLVDPVVCQSMYIFKQPGIGGEVTPHQDNTFLYTEPMKLYGLWIALEDATIENGCLWFIPGSHKNGLYGNRRMIRNPDTTPGQPHIVFTGDVTTFNDDQFIPVPVKKGSCVVLHGEVVHKSLHNKSEKSRHIYTFHVFDKKDTVYSPQNWLQETEALPFPSVYNYA